ncbi:hypothetical protein N7476_007389 [Penicillium atrosanguineum]|uniref:DNA ligase D 3'-phosphoesterase domain-containing protein n=1 Tax=Penicillium atrosanguineum TaxID=1132637 RepID=A0A9W9U3W4_9EURO|nr:hypothetical protein N7526_006938 [Penicillium atrosanguineum]KAJ5311529.1 hypothetical protein N7476_007389 [Penicillium atrosanguineum]
MKRYRSYERQQLDESPNSEAKKDLPLLVSLERPVSPPSRRAAPVAAPSPKETASGLPQDTSLSLAAIEAGEVKVTDHLGIISEKFKGCIRHLIPQSPHRLTMDEWTDLYRRNAHPQGRHFVIHQHDHPVAGPHYDLRLQFSKTSSVSWSIMYGMPGDPNSERLNRNATETRVHCLWNHILETASAKTGSIIIWDTGEYEILPWKREESLPQTDDSRSESDVDVTEGEQCADSMKLHEAFKRRKIRVRLHGARLPEGYTIILRLDKKTDYARPIRKGPKRRRRDPKATQLNRAPSTSNSDSDSHLSPGQTAPRGSPTPHDTTHSDNDVDTTIQKNNAYPGSHNTIGSIHQRRWYLSMDREASGFNSIGRHENRGKMKWARRQDNRGLSGFEPFYVRGPDIERSVVTGRLGSDVLSDEKVQGFQRRNLWRPVLN